VIVCAHYDEVSLYRSGAVENEGGWVLDFAQCPDGGDLSREQGAAAFNGLATGIYHGLAEFVVPLQIDRPGHDGRLEHAKIHSMYEHDVVRPVE
jgi:hypothetical protein